MAEFVFANIECNDMNDDGDAVTLYFKGEPTAEEVVEACENEDIPGNIGPIEPSEYWVSPTPVSILAGLVRVQTPAG